MVGLARPTALTEERRQVIEAKLAQGLPFVLVAEETGVSMRSLSRWPQEGA